MGIASAIDGLGEVDLPGLSDHDLLVRLRDDTQRAQFYEARSLAAGEEFRRRQERAQEQERRRVTEPFFVLTPIEETVVEVGPLVGADAGRVKGQLQRSRMLCADFPGLWELCRTGQLEVYKAAIIAEMASTCLDDLAEVAWLSQEMTRWLRAALPTGQGPCPLSTKTSKQIRNRVGYLLKKLKPQDADRRFEQAYRDRGVRLDPGLTDGIGHLAVTHALPYLQAADHRLTTLAKQRRRAGDDRTLSQLRADTMLDLILGKVTGPPGHEVRRDSTPPCARPVINVTVPIQTLMGFSEDPATLSGGTSIPAALARMLANDPDSTWYRMLTDPARTCVELTTHSYQPTRAIWRQCVADQPSCYHPTCDKPATTSELDHRVPYPLGPTSTGNLAPACKRDHKAKHAEGFSLQRRNDGTLTFSTRAGFTHRLTPETQPVSTRWPEQLMSMEERFAAIIHAHEFQHRPAETGPDQSPGRGPGRRSGLGSWPNKQALHHELAEEMAGRAAIR